MKKIRFSRTVVAGTLLVPLLVGAFVIQQQPDVEGARLLDQVLQLMSTRYADTIAANELYKKAAHGLVRELNDPYSVLFTPKEYRAFNQQAGGAYAGIGMLIIATDGVATVERVFPHTPAAEGGVVEGDKIIAIDTFTVRGWTTQQVSDKLQGAPGSTILVKFQRAGVAMPIPVTFTRTIVHIPVVPFTLVFNGNVGYVPLQEFSETAAQEVADAIHTVEKAGATRVVIDLRDNPGGKLDQAIATSNLFLHQGLQVTSVRGRSQDVQVFDATEQPQQPTIPLVLLIDGHSASASEILSGALQDHDRALIVGTTSFGKGLVQSLFELDGGYALKMTTGKWYTPSGRSIQKARKLLPDGEFVEVLPDSLESDSVKKARPQFKSDAGRIVYGDGGITPDLIVKPHTLSTGAQGLIKSLVPQQLIFATQLHDFALSMKGIIHPDFVVTPDVRQQFLQQLEDHGVHIDPVVLASGQAEFDRILGTSILGVAFGDSTVRRAYLSDDSQLVKAIALLKQAQDQQALLTIAQRETTQQMANKT